MENLTNPYFQTLFLISIFTLFFGLFSLFFKERLYLAESLVATLFGILIGPKGFNMLNPCLWPNDKIQEAMTLEFSRIIIALQVMAVGLTTPFSFIKKEWPSILVFLLPGMIFSWVTSSFIIWNILKLPIFMSMLIGACLTPTDPVLANAVIKGKFANRYIPGNIRNVLSVESGANDGLGFAMVALPIYLYLYNYNHAIKKWLIITWGYEILVSLLVGIFFGYTFKKLLEFSEKNKLIDKESFLVYSIMLAISIVAFSSLISVDDLLAVFVAANIFSHDDHFRKSTKDAHLQEVIEMLFNISYFVYFGTIIPWRNFKKIGYFSLIGASLAIIFFRRLPFIMAFQKMIPCIKSNREAFFCGWFGPMGVGALFFALASKEHGLPPLMTDQTFSVVSFVVLSSIIVHGITVPITHVHMKAVERRKLFLANSKQLINQNEIDPYAETIDLRGQPIPAIYESLAEAGQIKH